MKKNGVLFSSLFLLINIFSVSFSLAYIDDLNELRNQSTIKRHLRKVDASLWAWLDPTAYDGVASSLISYARQLPEKKLADRDYKEIFITTEDKKTTRMYIKMEKSPRPLIIFVSGLSSPANANYFSHYALPANKYFGFNVALVENSTSFDWEKRNQTLLSSGYEAGWDLYLKLRALKKHPEVAPYVSEVHVVAISLGGSDISFASYFDSILETNVIDGGIMAFSSPADRLNSYTDLKKVSGPVVIGVNEMFRRTYGDGSVYRKYTNKDFYWIFWQSSHLEAVQEIYLKSANEYFAKYRYHFELLNNHDSTLFKIDKNGYLLSLNEMIKLFDLENFLPDIKKPILWIQSENDPVVKFETNGEFVARNKNSLFDLYETKYGGHAGHPQAYGGAWVMEHIFRYVQYWGKYPESYYNKWRKPYEHKFYFSRYLAN